jgi:glycosyltransferase involved in cell wall biosynthesis
VIGHIDPQHQLPETSGVNLLVLNKPNVRSMLFPIWRYLRITKPDVVFTAEDHLNAVVLLAAIASGSCAKISGSSRVTPYDTYSTTWFSKRWYLKQIMRLVMWRADVLTCVSQDMVMQYRNVFSSPPHLCVYNIVDDERSHARMNEPVEHPWLKNKTVPILVAAGRLAPWKGFTDLIEAVALVNARRPVHLLILGDGPLRNDLLELVDSRGLRDVVQLLGYVENPLKYFAKSDVFVLSSLVEGLPNVLVEAMMCGCTPVATDCPTGPREVLLDGKYGYLVQMRNPEALANGIMQALNLPIAKELLEEAVRPFAEKTVIDRHIEVLGLTNSMLQ